MQSVIYDMCFTLCVVLVEGFFLILRGKMILPSKIMKKRHFSKNVNITIFEHAYTRMDLTINKGEDI